MSAAAEREERALIHQRNLDRNRVLCRTAADAYLATEGGSDARVEAALPAALGELAAYWREEAEREMRANRRGAKGRATELRAAASLAAGVAESIKLHGADPGAPDAPANPNPHRDPLTADEMHAAGPVFAAPANDGGPITPEVARAIRESPYPESVGGIGSADLDHVPLPEPEVVGMPGGLSDPDPVERLVHGAPAGGSTLTWVQLSEPPPERPVEHLSNSQIDDLSDCAMKYRLSRLHGIARRPSWSLIGGNALHAAIETLELAGAMGPGPTRPWADVAASHDLAQLWSATFHRGIAERATVTAFPQERWHAAVKGLEGYTWWLGEGLDMLARYVAQRASWGQRHEILRLDGVPVVEWEAEPVVAGVPVKAIVDQAWIERSTGTIVVRDIKSGRSTPAGPLQLTIAAVAIRQAMPSDGTAPAWANYRGHYWSARKGDAGEIVGDVTGLLSAERVAELEYRAGAAHAQKRAGIFPPRPSTFCGSCGVRDACPAAPPRREIAIDTI